MCEWLDSESIKSYTGLFTAALVPFSIYLAYLQIKKSLEWNKKKTAEEALDKIVTGSAIMLFEQIQGQFSWSLLTEDRKYNDVIRDLNAEQQAQLDKMLSTVLCHFETIAIKIEHDVYDESICFDYLFSILITTHAGCASYIEKARAARKEPRLFEHVEKYAKKWQEEVSKGRVH